MVLKGSLKNDSLRVYFPSLNADFGETRARNDPEHTFEAQRGRKRFGSCEAKINISVSLKARGTARRSDEYPHRESGTSEGGVNQGEEINEIKTSHKLRLYR